MNRPFLLRIAPRGLRSAIYHRLYRKHRQNWKELYENAPLDFAPDVRMNLRPTDEGHSEIAFTGFYELDLTRRIAKHAHTGGLMIDVGANYGYFSLLWTAALMNNRVIAFEASPRNHAALERNVSMNNLGSRVDIRKMALGKEAGILPFSLGGEEQTGWGGLTTSADEATVDVPVATLDSCVGSDEAIEVLKIDVEGADTWVLFGAEKFLQAKRIKHVYFEGNKDRMNLLGIGPNDAPDFLRKVGYRAEALNDPDSGLVEYHATPGN